MTFIVITFTDDDSQELTSADALGVTYGPFASHQEAQAFVATLPTQTDDHDTDNVLLHEYVVVALTPPSVS